MFRILLINFIVLILCVSHAQAQTTCAPKPIGKINVTWGSTPIEYDFTKSQAQMDAIQNDTKNPYGAHVDTHVGGLMEGGINLKSQINLATLTYPRSRQTCQWVDTMDVAITIDPKIYISNSYKKGTCRHNAIMEHEMKHVFVDREIVKKYTPLIRSQLNNAIRKVGIVGPKPEKDQKKYAKKINDYMNDQLKIITDKMYAERKAKQQAVDNIKEYERVASLCK